MKFKLLPLLASLTFLVSAPLLAGTVTFNFASCNVVGGGGACPGNLQTPQAWFVDNSNTSAIGALGLMGPAWNPAPMNLNVKAEGTAETGLGLAANDGEINYNQYIFLNMVDLASTGLTMGNVELGSLQAGEVAEVCGTFGCENVAEQGNTGLGWASVSWSGTDPFLAFTVPQKGDGNFLIESISATDTPEPSTLTLMGIAFIGIGLVGRRRYRATA